MATQEQNKSYYEKNKEKIKDRRKKSTSEGFNHSFYAYSIILFASLTVTISRSANYHMGEGVPWPLLSSVLLEVSFIGVLLHRGLWPKVLGTLIGGYIAATLVIPSYNGFQTEFSLNSEVSELKKDISDLKAYQVTQKKYSYEYNLARNDIKRKEKRLEALNQSESEKIQTLTPRSYLNSVGQIAFYLLLLLISVFFSQKVKDGLSVQRVKAPSLLATRWKRLKSRFGAVSKAWKDSDFREIQSRSD